MMIRLRKDKNKGQTLRSVKRNRRTRRAVSQRNSKQEGLQETAWQLLDSSSNQERMRIAKRPFEVITDDVGWVIRAGQAVC